ncbi:MAG: trypsin-like peptidase domain-containing protein [Vicinamibacterales bacterium]|nr:trypsin-like peptidase domain-containing protein [Vicinamibacterales bacterium]
MFRRLALSFLLLVAGLAAGLVIAGRLPVSNPLVAAPPASAAAAPAQPALAAPASTPDFTAVAARTVSAVTNISSVQVVRRSNSPFANDPFFQQFFPGMDDMFGSRSRYASSLGSGVIVSADGYVLTNNHVVGEAGADVTVSLGDKRELPARIIGVDSWTDLALLKIDARDLPVIPWGDSSTLRVAEWVMAIGNPFQLNQTVTLGIVSALGRANVGISAYEDFIQTDAAINPGNSGGALINGRGELIGINTAIFSQSGGYQGIGFAVPSNLARRIVDDLIQYGQVRRGSLGYMELSPLTTRLAEQLRAESTEGLVVTAISREAPAYQAGLQPGDILVAVNGQAIQDSGQLLRLVSDLPVGGTATVDYLRDGRRRSVQVTVEPLQARRRSR